MDEQKLLVQLPTARPPNTEVSQVASAQASIQKTLTVDTSASPRSIEELTNVVLSRKEQIAYSYIEIGKALIEAKEQLIKHGGWLKWLSDVVDIPP